jgi:hypothetical protein
VLFEAVVFWNVCCLLLQQVEEALVRNSKEQIAVVAVDNVLLDKDRLERWWMMLLQLVVVVDTTKNLEEPEQVVLLTHWHFETAERPF